jgi:4'-phosphopantetheinyl transferase
LNLAQNNPEIQHFEVKKGLRYAFLDLDKFALHIKSDNKRVIEKGAALHLVRNVLQNAEADILYEESGKPYVKDGPHISISHSYNYIVVLFSEHGEVGIDIEKVRDKIIQIRRKFLSPAELKQVENASLEEHTIYWCAKEALYKASGISGLIFAQQLHIEPFVYTEKGGEIKALLTNDNSEKKYTLQYQVLNEYILVYTDNSLA